MHADYNLNMKCHALTGIFLKSVQQQQQVLHLGANPFMDPSWSRRTGELERWIWIRTLGSASHAMGSHKRQATTETGIYEAFCICSEAKVFEGGSKLGWRWGLGFGFGLDSDSGMGMVFGLCL